MLLKESNNKISHLKELEYGKQTLEEFDKIMQKLEQERIDYSNSIKQKAKIQDLRQSLINNVKDTENELKRELEQKFMKEKEEIEQR
jgi:hypothetical protein